MAGTRPVSVAPCPLLLWLGFVLIPSAAATSHPVASVIELLQDLRQKVEAEGKEEALTYEKFAYWCRGSEKTLGASIATEKATLDKLDSEIDSHKKNIEVLGKGIEALTMELGELAKAGAAADADRTAGENLYKAESGALNSTIKAISDAVDALTAAKGSTDSGLFLSQRRVREALALIGTAVSTSQRGLLEAFASPERPELKAKGDYGSHVKRYSFKSSSVIELLKELQAKFEEEVLAVTVAETNAINAYKLAKAARGDLEAAATASKTAKASEKGEAEADLAAAESALSDTQGDLDADSKTFDETQKQCAVKKSEWAERSELRAGEQEAIKAAIEILAKVSGVRTDAPGNPVPPPSPVAFLQVVNPKTKRAVQLLRQEARAAHSKALEQLAQEVAAHDSGPFDEAVNMIEKMIFRLMNEQKEEDDHKKWCDLELNKTNASIADKEDKISELTVKIDEAEASAMSLAEDIDAANQMVSDIVAHTKEATEIREIGRKENALAVKDAQDAQKALANAVAVLKTFYKESGKVPKESWEFLQRARAPVELPETPSTWSSGYTGVADPAAQPEGIVTVLEKVSADFSEMEADTAAQEKADQDAYDEDMKDCAIEKARRTKETEMKAQERQRLIEKQRSMEASRKGVAGEKAATEQYLKDLQPACVEGGSTYDDRRAARAQEVDGLREAQGLLQGAFSSTASGTAPPSFLQARRRLLRGA